MSLGFTCTASAASAGCTSTAPSSAALLPEIVDLEQSGSEGSSVH